MPILINLRPLQPPAPIKILTRAIRVEVNEHNISGAGVASIALGPGSRSKKKISDDETSHFWILVVL